MSTFIRAEFHIHTVLSPCADIEMIPPLIVEQALSRNIHLIAITDHNHTANIEAVQKAAEGTPLKVLPGMELQTSEEVHVLCLFEELEQAKAFQKIVDEHLPNLENNIDFFGEQFVVDETGDFVRREERLLLTSTSLNLHQAWEEVQALGGLFIPAHVNRKAFGLLPTLGMIPLDTPIEIVEISRDLPKEKVCELYPQICSTPFIQSGDAHFLDDILGWNHLWIPEISLKEISLAIQSLSPQRHQIISD
ncbi:PHP domain-containing protein [Anaerolinea sp.]|uniref:PHP domain-containing protein n=1 Tax=Anaerolinea sp. TaxID=1872519 RepID=UPI002ACD511C|nr:PHP domain-containing protein [Anaerolinea sp.]